MVKRIALFLLLTLFINSVANANDIDDLKAFAQRASLGSEIGFIFTAIDKSGSMLYSSEGTTLVYDEMFKVEIPDEIIIVDNKVTRWLYNMFDEEILVMDVTLEEASIADNPFVILRENNIDSIKNYTIKFVSRDGDIPTSLLSVPQKIELTSLAGIKYTIEITSFKESPQLSSYNFVLDATNYPDAFVVEM